MRRGLGFALLALFLVGPAAADPQDPFEREAEDALVSYLHINTSNPPGNETEGARFLQQMLVKEKCLTRARDALAAERRRMP